MTEKEKCRQVLLYNANYDTALINERNTCKTLCQEYNKTEYLGTEKRRLLLLQILDNT